MPMSKPRVVVLGAGGHGRVILDALLAADQSEVVGFLDDDLKREGERVFGFPVLGLTSQLKELAEKVGFERVAVAVGDNFVRDQKLRQVQESGLRAATVVHPSARISRFVEIGNGVVILAGAVINPGTILEDNVCVNTAASVDHDNHLGRSCHIFPHATLTGGVRVGEFSYIGSGAVVNPYLRIGNYAYVGAGAVVTRDVSEGIVVAGVPAREIKKQSVRPS